MLRHMGLSTGYLIATPTIINILQSCTDDVKTWTPDFLSAEHIVLLNNIADILLPKTDIPSATDLNVSRFIDKYINEVFNDKKQEQMRTGFNKIVEKLKEKVGESINKATESDYKSLLDKYMLVKGDIDKEREANLESLILTKSEFLNSIKSMCIKAYLTTEEIGENVLIYDPIPTTYYCGDLQELTGGKSWSL